MARRRNRRSAKIPPPSSPTPAPARADSAERHEGGLKLEAQAWGELLREARSFLAPILAALALALVLRLLRLGHSEVWLDEVLVFEDAIAGTNTIISPAHRLHLGAVGWILNHLGTSAFCLRLWGAVHGSLAAPAVALAAGWLGGRRLAWACGVLAAIHPFLVFYSQDANYYGTMGFFAAVQVALFVAFFRGAPLASLLGLLLAGGLSFLNHPFSLLFTGLAAGGCVLGSFVYPSLRRDIYRWNPKEWAGSPAVPLVIAAVVVGGPVVAHGLGGAVELFKSRLSWGEPPGNVSLSYGFFDWVATCYGVTYFRNEHAAARLLAWVPFGLFVGGAVVLARRAARVRPALPLAGLAVLAVVLGLAAIFNLRHHGFYPRYLTFLLPPAIVVAGAGALALGEWLHERHAGAPSWVMALPVVLIAAIQLPFLAWYYASDRSNFRGLAETLEESHKPGEPVWAVARVEQHQADYYLGRRGDGSIDPASIRLWGFYGKYDAVIRGALGNQLFGRDNVWLISSWRWAPRPELWGFLDALGQPLYEGHSPHAPQQDARLYHWTAGGRVLHPTAASFNASGSGPWFALGPGTWRTDPAGETVTAEGAGFLTPNFSTPPPIVAPVYGEIVSIGPFDQIDLPGDQRHAETMFGDVPVFERRYDGAVSHLLWVPPGEQRHLVLKAVRRTEAALAEASGRAGANADLYLALACNGVHQGVWRLAAGEREELVELPITIELPPGNNRLDIHGFTPRLGYTPDNNWQWAGLDFVAGEAPDPVSRWDGADGAAFVSFPRPLLAWGEAGESEPPGISAEMGRSYARSVSPQVVGPSGLPALTVDLDRLPQGAANAYHFIFGAALPVDGEVMGFSTYLRLDDTDTHAAALAVGFFDESGRLLHAEIGHQQLMVAPLNFGWRRFVEICPVPPALAVGGSGVRVAYVAPGVIVFPPDPDRAHPRGQIHVDAFAGLEEAKGPFAEPTLQPGIIGAP
ncbi:MAG: mannosyltransferase [Candidatus Sumerlaeota bacterium]|nr:mannosyltransferase [Candidatus Sumerlaeota bacterium]